MNYTKEKKEKRFTIKDLITIGVFTAIILISGSILGGFLAINPLLTFYFPIAAAVLPGTPYLLLIAKVPKRGVIFMVGVIGGVLAYTMGMHWAMAIGGVIASFIADLVTGIKKYRSSFFNIFSYVIYCFGSMGTYFAYFVNREAWINYMLKSSPADYIKKMESVASPKVLIIMVVGTVIVALISGLIGKKLLNKQFEKAGII